MLHALSCPCRKRLLCSENERYWPKSNLFSTTFLSLSTCYLGPTPFPSKECRQDKELFGEEASGLVRAGGETLALVKKKRLNTQGRQTLNKTNYPMIALSAQSYTFKIFCLSYFLHKSDENNQNYLVKENTHASLFCTLLLQRKLSP